MELTLSRAHFTTWFKNTSIVAKDQNSISVSVPNAFIREWLENKFNRKILDSIRNLHPEIREIKYIVGQLKIDPKQDVSAALIEKELEERSVPDKEVGVDPTTNLNKKYSFESFIVGSNNELAFASALRVAKNPGKDFNPLFLYGGVGLGKTHLLQAVGNKALSDDARRRVLYIPAERLTSELIEAIKNRTLEEIKTNYSRLDLLMIDDVQFIAGKEKTQEIIFSIFNELHIRNKQIILSSDRPAKAIPALEERLRSRLEWGMAADIGIPDYETRLAILNQKIQGKDFACDSEVLSYIATNIQKNVRELEGALNRVIAFGQIYNKTPDLKEVKNILNTYLNTPYKKTSPQIVLRSVADFYSISPGDLIKRSRKKEVVRPRQVAMFLLREETKLSFPEIGQKLGGRDHSTVIHACEKIKKEELNSEPLKQELLLIRERVYNSFDK